jgi:hypothetical protein
MRAVGAGARACRRRASAALAAGLVILPGCVGTSWPRGTWTKAGVEPRQQRHDEYECGREAVAAAPGAARAAAWEHCLRARGYERVR